MATPSVPWPAEPGYDEEALAEIELTSSVMIAANAADDPLDAREVDRALGVSSGS